MSKKSKPGYISKEVYKQWEKKIIDHYYSKEKKHTPIIPKNKKPSHLLQTKYILFLDFNGVYEKVSSKSVKLAELPTKHKKLIYHIGKKTNDEVSFGYDSDDNEFKYPALDLGGNSVFRSKLKTKYETLLNSKFSKDTSSKELSNTIYDTWCQLLDKKSLYGVSAKDIEKWLNSLKKLIDDEEHIILRFYKLPTRHRIVVTQSDIRKLTGNYYERLYGMSEEEYAKNTTDKSFYTIVEEFFANSNITKKNLLNEYIPYGKQNTKKKSKTKKMNTSQFKLFLLDKEQEYWKQSTKCNKVCHKIKTNRAKNKKMLDKKKQCHSKCEKTRLKNIHAVHKQYPEEFKNYVKNLGGGGKTRKGPSESATLFKKGTKKKGNDGNMWIIGVDKRGVHRWKPFKNVSVRKRVVKKPKGKQYLIHDNGGRPFLVAIDKKGVSIFKLSEGDDEDDAGISKKDYTHLIKEYKNVKRVFIGKSKKTDEKETFPDGYGPKFDGNTILVEIQSKRYCLISESIIEFSTKDTIEKYDSPVGLNDVPYPVAYGSDNVYVLGFDKNQYVPKESVKNMNTGELLDTFSGECCPWKSVLDKYKIKMKYKVIQKRL